MKLIKFKVFSTLLTILICMLSISHVKSQNNFPTAKGTNVRIDGGAIDYAAPVTTGGWARGIRFFSSDLSTHFFGLGMLGSKTQASRFYMGFDPQSPWESKLGLHILTNGNVGIGVTNPVARLAVNGNILATEIKIKTDIAVPDYVFDPAYRLPTLSSVEDYVKKHRHLPEIPSAAQMQKDGVDLTEMNLALLKKVEELTLHLIAKEKEIDELKENQKNCLRQLSERLDKLERN